MNLRRGIAFLLLLPIMGCIRSAGPDRLPREQTDWVVFSDADFNPNSASRVSRLGTRSAIQFAVSETGYGGISRLLHGRSFLRVHGIDFQYELEGGSFTHLELQSISGTRQRLELSQFVLESDKPRKQVSVPMTAFHMLEEAELSEISQIGFVVAGSGELRISQLSLRGEEPVISEDGSETVEEPAAGPVLLPEEQKPALVMPDGHGIWLFATSTDAALRIRRHNSAGLPPIKYLFVSAGTVGNFVDTDMRIVNFYLEHLSKLWVFPSLTGRGEDIPTDPVQRKRLAGTVALIAAYPQLAGLHLDISPMNENVRHFLSEVNAEMSKPFSAAIPAHAPALRVTTCDLPVLKGFNLSNVPADFGGQLRRQSASFAAAAATYRRRFMIGLPFTATDVEYEGAGVNTRMSAFTDEALHQASDWDDNPYLAGFAIWAVQDSGLEPREIGDRGWQAFSALVRE
ncbi:MAG: hypothetical protein ACI8W8_001910 [Rhodothermales bacterium]|jgi:hypothetical protein